MAHREGEKQVSFYIDEEEKEQFNTLCKTMNVSVGVAMRNFIIKANQEQNLGISVAASDTPRPLTKAVQSGVDDAVLKNILKRLDNVEQSVPNFDVDELKKVRKEVLSGEFGSMRYRMGIIENQVQELGGSIAWTNKPQENESVGDKS